MIMSNPSFTNKSELQCAKLAWSLRIRSIGSLIQVIFAGFWLVRGVMAIPFWWRYDLAWACALSSMAIFIIGTAATWGKAGRPLGECGRHLERKVNIATVIQLAASFALPVIVGAYGRSDLILPAVVVSVGPLLWYFWYLFGIPRYGFVGFVLTVGPLLLVLVLHGSSLIAVTGLLAGALALGLDILSLHDVMIAIPPEEAKVDS